MANRVKVSDGAVQKQDSELQLVIRFFTYGSFDCCLPPVAIFRVDALQPFLPSRHARFPVEAPYAIPFLGQVQGFSSRDPPNPTPRMRESLRFRQIPLAAPQCFFSPPSVLDIDVVSVPAENVPGAVTQRAGAAQEPAVFSVEAPDAYLCFEGVSLRHRYSPFVAQLFNIGAAGRSGA